VNVRRTSRRACPAAVSSLGKRNCAVSLLDKGIPSCVRCTAMVCPLKVGSNLCPSPRRFRRAEILREAPRPRSRHRCGLACPRLGEARCWRPRSTRRRRRSLGLRRPPAEVTTVSATASMPSAAAIVEPPDARVVPIPRGWRRCHLSSEQWELHQVTPRTAGTSGPGTDASWPKGVWWACLEKAPVPLRAVIAAAEVRVNRNERMQCSQPRARPERSVLKPRRLPGRVRLLASQHDDDAGTVACANIHSRAAAVAPPGTHSRPVHPRPPADRDCAPHS